MVLLELRLYSVVDSVMNEFGAIDERTLGRELIYAKNTNSFAPVSSINPT
jgi:hypothetical protein